MSNRWLTEEQVAAHQRRMAANLAGGLREIGLEKEDAEKLGAKMATKSVDDELRSLGVPVPKSETVTFTVPGEPVGKGRARFARRGAFVSAYTPEKTVRYENMVGLAADLAMNGRPLFTGACSIKVEAYCSIPQSWSKKKRAAAMAGTLRPTTKPDLDNILKALGDAMNSVVFHDDKQIAEVAMGKFYADTPRLEVAVTGV